MLKTYKVTLVSDTPVIYNRLKRELQLEIKDLKKDQIDDWEAHNWRRKAEFDEEQNLVFPTEWIKGVLEAACKASRMVPHFATSKNQTYTSYASSMVVIIKQTLGKVNDLIEYAVYVNGRGSMGKGGSKVFRIRPMLKSWKLTFELKDPFGRMKIEELKELLEYAGLMIGVGDNRKNNYGRFQVKEIKEVK
jgi:hypothetical protein